jgi:twitching motility protein PilT
MLSVSLAAVISQSLLPKNGGGRIAIHEVLINNSAISNLIRENKIHQIYSQIQLNQQKTGMITQTQSMLKAIKAGMISKEDAIRHSTQPQELMNLIGV